MYKCVEGNFNEIILNVEGLSKYFTVKKTPISKKHIIKAVDDVSLTIKKGEVFGLIGESGSGKTTLGGLILKLIEGRSGKIVFNGRDITNIEEKHMKQIRKEMQVIFQYTQEILDPQMTVEEQISEPLKLHSIVPNIERDKEIDRLLGLVGISVLEKHKFPYQLSGGQRQRIGIARAISTKPQFIVCDEPISALDVSIQGQILNLLTNLRNEMGLTYLFISHDLKIVNHFCDRIGVMYNGKLVEMGEKKDIMNNPQNEYTKMLIKSQL